MSFLLKPAAWHRCARAGLVCGMAWAAAAPAQQAAPLPGHEIILEARTALRLGDHARLGALHAALARSPHPLAQWVDYWQTSQRLPAASQPEVSAFLGRWPGTYVADRLHTEWLLELGRRRDWAGLARASAGLRAQAGGEAPCYTLLLRHRAGEDVAAPARRRWLAQRDADEGCSLLAASLHQARRFSDADVWLKLRSAAEFNRARLVRPAAALLGDAVAAQAAEAFDNPQRHLARAPRGRHGTWPPADAELVALALVRLADGDAAAAAAQIDARWAASLPPATLAWAWAGVAKQAAMNLHPRAHEWYRRAAMLRAGGDAALSDDLLAWKVRAALRAEGTAGRWEQLLEAIDAMSPAGQREPAWVYWKARAFMAMAQRGRPGEQRHRAQAAALLEPLAGQLHFYGKLAAEELGRPQVLPPRPAPLTTQELARARSHAGLTRALELITIGLRDEGVREWNFSLRGMDDRALRAAAQRACAAEVWDRCINTSERTLVEIDIEQRFPTPFSGAVEAAAREAGLDPAYVYGVIRQESRFMADARSAVGASGLMQLMPATARWTARKLGLAGFQPGLINDPATNLRIGAGYLKLMLDDFDASQALAAAAYNAGPGRPRRWRDGSTPEVAAWVESIPFSETRDYVKTVLSNATYYGARLRGEALSLKSRLAVPAVALAAQPPAATPREAGIESVDPCAGLPPGACPVGRQSSWAAPEPEAAPPVRAAQAGQGVPLR
jgi:soluble lytic murein transglycosylase